ncbi:peptidoglycan-associated lipoprotein Pal [Cohaesibacter celericrescens]|uniref:Peptidoglycan-associated lipoprotein n=1 Tax=Cohaesibacter celericrescens TaxID=2067669 RepID=A0A2N5XL11_9HYPH|nr:peptidoglycan-associated lipoprotein Pal [Cohaesibacter celericrescens]PLW75216.1 peptidoglycan-associated lipoprotein [Cohaesibacter celericrescens]
MSNRAKSPLRAALAVALLTALAACSSTPDKLTNSSLSSAAPGSAQDFVVNVGDRVFFDTDSSDVNVTSQATLDKQAVWLQQYANYRVAIEGHADERGTREYNIALGARRANAVRNYLVSKGISANRMSTRSFGKERPVAVCNDISCWSQNRRAVTALTN